MDTFLMTLLMLAGIFLILLVLVQRGRGGGLAGAFGGMGGQSAFGTKAGDVFTKITAGAAVVWVLLSGFCILALRASSDSGYEPENAVPSAGAGASSEDTSETGGTKTDDASNDLMKSLDGSKTSGDTKTTPPATKDSSDESQGDAATDAAKSSDADASKTTDEK